MWQKVAAAQQHRVDGHDRLGLTNEQNVDGRGRWRWRCGGAQHRALRLRTHTILRRSSSTSSSRSRCVEAVCIPGEAGRAYGLICPCFCGSRSLTCTVANCILSCRTCSVGSGAVRTACCVMSASVCKSLCVWGAWPLQLQHAGRYRGQVVVCSLARRNGDLRGFSRQPRKNVSVRKTDAGQSGGTRGGQGGGSNMQHVPHQR